MPSPELSVFPDGADDVLSDAAQPELGCLVIEARAQQRGLLHQQEAPAPTSNTCDEVTHNLG